MGRVIARIAAGFYGEPRYRPSPLQRGVADTGIKIGEAG